MQLDLDPLRAEQLEGHLILRMEWTNDGVSSSRCFLQHPPPISPGQRSGMRDHEQTFLIRVERCPFELRNRLWGRAYPLGCGTSTLQIDRGQYPKIADGLGTIIRVIKEMCL